jgi:DNA-binding MurR/RpiR family transcriptional regulator
MSGSSTEPNAEERQHATGTGPTAEALLTLLREGRDNLSPKLAAAAAYLLASPDEIAFTSMRRMAERAGVQPAIMVRLAQRLGLDGYEALRAPFRAVRERRPDGLGQRARDLQARVEHRGGGHALARLANERIALDCENLDATLASIGGERLADMAGRLAAAQRLYVAGTGGAYAAAFRFSEIAGSFRPDVVLLGGAGRDFGAELRGPGDDDMLLAFSFAPHAAELVRTLRFARGRGAAVVAVTDGPAPALTGIGAAILPVVTDETGAAASVVPAVALAQVLADQMLASGGQAALDGIAETEARATP